jgi:GT2 family glycosyltransferase
MEEAHTLWQARGKLKLDHLLSSNEVHEIPLSHAPLVTFVLVVLDKAHLTYLSLESVLQFADVPYELIVVDNASTDATPAMLQRFAGARIIRNQSNVGFGPACMQAASAASGRYLCFLNNDALLTPGAVKAALNNFEHGRVGAVGAKILLANGSLQEAGSIIWSDGSALGYGRGDNPDLLRYNFRRPVDYCSAVFMVTPRDLFNQLGGFKEEFAPAYYEDTDYCMALWQNNWSVIYEPLATISHYESASSGNNEFAQAKMAAHQVTFQKKWKGTLASHYSPDSSNVPAARFAVHSTGSRIVYIDDRIPKRTLGAGYPRSNEIVTELARMGHKVTCSTSTFPLPVDSYEDLPREIEVFDGCRFPKILVDDYMRSADVVWLSRPHNVKRLLQEFPDLFSARKFAFVYDAEAIFAPRARARKDLLGVADEYVTSLVPADLDEEIALAKLADVVVVVSEADRDVMCRAGVRSVKVIGHSLTPNPTPAPFAQRECFLFVGAMHGADNPNADSIRDFYRRCWGQIHRETGATFIVAGYGTEVLRTEINDPSVQILGAQTDLRALYDRARVFVIPTRYAAGIPFKAHEATAQGVPLVVSPVIAEQLRWEHGSEYLAASSLDEMAPQCIRLYRDRELWERTRTNSLGRASTELSPEAFVDRLREVLDEVTNVRTSV